VAQSGGGSVAGVGQHYVPQAYLRHFQIPDRPGFFWLFDKQGGEPHIASITKVVQSHDYYSLETEAALARNVEKQGNQAMERLLQGKQLNSSERDDLSFYIAVMLMRGPYRRRMFLERYPKVLAETMAETRSEIMAAALAADPAYATPLLAQVNAIGQQFALHPPPKVVAQMREPSPDKSMVAAIHNMVWRVLESSGPCYFITSDTPVFLHADLGLGLPESEVCFPLSTTRALHGCWYGQRGSLTFLQASQQSVKEINRRLASMADRLAFYHEPAPWLQQILSKTYSFQNLIK